MRCLVTGNLGYIGYIVSNELIKSGHEVVGYDYGYFPDEAFGRKDAFNATRTIKQIRKDIRKVSDEDLKNIDAVIHLAGLADDPDGKLSPELQLDVNYNATVELAAKAKRGGVSRFIFASSTSVYGVRGDELLNEDSKCAPVTDYAKHKLNSEQALLNMNSSNFSVTCARIATAFGISPRMRIDTILNGLTAYAYAQGKMIISGNGMNWRPAVHIEDIARAYIMMLNADESKVANQVFAVGLGSYRINELASAVREQLPNSTIEYIKEGNDRRSYNVSFDKIKNVLGFRAKYSINEGIKELIKGYEEFDLTKDNIMQNRFWSTNYYKQLVDGKPVDE